MYMKKLIPLFFILVALAACEKDPDLDKVQDQVVTYTQYDKTENFGTARTYYLTDSILLINQSPDTTYLDKSISEPIISAMASNMNSRGYTRVTDKKTADLGLQLSYIESTYYFAISDNPYWWDNYPAYWWPGYWGNWWGDWYYPYYNVFSYSNGSLLTGMVDLRTTSTSTDQKLRVVWQAYSVGLLQGSKQQNIDNAVAGVNQAFTQSPYIKVSK